jgi:hypothetical protein
LHEVGHAKFAVKNLPVVAVHFRNDREQGKERDFVPVVKDQVADEGLRGDVVDLGFVQEVADAGGGVVGHLVAEFGDDGGNGVARPGDAKEVASASDGGGDGGEGAGEEDESNAVLVFVKEVGVALHVCVKDVGQVAGDGFKCGAAEGDGFAAHGGFFGDVAEDGVPVGAADEGEVDFDVRGAGSEEVFAFAAGDAEGRHEFATVNGVAFGAGAVDDGVAHGCRTKGRLCLFVCFIVGGSR